ncbi:MAG: transaldolase family protein [Candidatus Bathyarchaeia archaeon]
MKIFLDTASLKEIKEILPWGIVEGITTNQKIFEREAGCDFETRVKQIVELIDGPVSIEITSNQIDKMIAEAERYSSWNPEKIVLKVPMMGDGTGLKVVSILRSKGIKTNMTALMTTNQVILASKAGATYASIFYNRTKDAGNNPDEIIRNSVAIIEKSGLPTQIIVGSIRTPDDVWRAAVSGAHIVTIPYNIITQMPFHPKTEETIKEFDEAWRKFLRASPPS